MGSLKHMRLSRYAPVESSVNHYLHLLLHYYIIYRIFGKSAIGGNKMFFIQYMNIYRYINFYKYNYIYVYIFIALLPELYAHKYNTIVRTIIYYVFMHYFN